MCGRYALGIRAAFVRHQLQEHGMPVDEAPEDEETRETYNFAPGYHGLVYRADVPDHGAGNRRTHPTNTPEDAAGGDEAPEDHGTDQSVLTATDETSKPTKYRLQAMKWGLVPFWTKRNPDYKSVMKTINARDDSLIENRGMWNTMKQRKRCVVIAQGFYEWLKKNGGRDKIPHYTKRPDGQLMCFAGLWDCVQYEGSDEKLYTYTIITTDSNQQLSFLHDRMPVILENGSDELRTWLDVSRTEWSRELQSILKPYQGELECYPVSKDVGKVGNNSPSFTIPITSSENKNNIANFFGNAKGAATTRSSQAEIKKEEKQVLSQQKTVSQEKDEKRTTIDTARIEDNAPMPVPLKPDDSKPATKRKRDDTEPNVDKESSPKVLKHTTSLSKSLEKIDRKSRSATSNGSRAKDNPKKTSDGSQRITNFFNA